MFIFIEKNMGGARWLKSPYQFLPPRGDDNDFAMDFWPPHPLHPASPLTLAAPRRYHRYSGGLRSAPHELADATAGRPPAELMSSRRRRRESQCSCCATAFCEYWIYQENRPQEEDALTFERNLLAWTWNRDFSTDTNIFCVILILKL